MSAPIFSRVFTRNFSSTPVVQAKHAKKRIEHMLRNAPPYPAPVPHTFKQAWFGLYGGRHIQFGNNVPDSEYKTRRYWLPNASNKKVWSRALGRYIELRIAKGVLRKCTAPCLRVGLGEWWAWYGQWEGEARAVRGGFFQSSV